jgi:hypothetical protein
MNKPIIQSLFNLSNRLNLSKKIIVIRDEKEFSITCNKRVKELQTSLDKAIAHKNEGNYDLDGISIESIIDTRKADLVEFLRENNIVPSEKGFEAICNLAEDNWNYPKDFPRPNIDFVFTTEQEKILKDIGKQDKNWLESNEGQEKEKEFATDLFKNGSIGKRQFALSTKNGKAFISGGYRIDAEYTEEIEKANQERLGHKRRFQLLEDSEQKPIEGKTCKELRLELSALGKSTKGTKAELVARLS